MTKIPIKYVYERMCNEENERLLHNADYREMSPDARQIVLDQRVHKIFRDAAKQLRARSNVFYLKLIHAN